MIWVDNDQIDVFFHPDHERTRPFGRLGCHEGTCAVRDFLGVDDRAFRQPAASRSVAGARHGPPNALEAPNPTSSSRISKTLGTPAGGRTGCTGGKELSGSPLSHASISRACPATSPGIPRLWVNWWAGCCSCHAQPASTRSAGQSWFRSIRRGAPGSADRWHRSLCRPCRE